MLKERFRSLTGSKVFNADETNFRFCPEESRGLAKKSTKYVYNVDYANTKFYITVMFTFLGPGNSVELMTV